LAFDVSVIIPVYNGENKIKYSIDSVLKQKNVSVEIIVINDGSTDSTLEVLKTYSERYDHIKVFTQPNLGVSSARNKGIEVAKGTYVCFLDADDFYEDNYLNEMLTKIKYDRKKVCYCGYKIVTPQGIRVKRTKFSKVEVLKKYILGQAALHTTSWLIDRQFLIDNSVKFPEGVSWGEDFEFFCEVLSLTKEVTFVKKHLTNYRFGYEENQLSSFSMDKIDKDVESILRLISNKRISNQEGITDSLLNYRLQALITYRLLTAVELNVEASKTLNYYRKYNNYLSDLSKINGLRSIKLELSKKKLSNKISNLSHR